jgi:antitoxin CptB
MHAADDVDRNRIHWQCRRGMRELDELLGSFMAEGYDALDRTGRVHMMRLLEFPDPLLLAWLMGRAVPADRDVAHIVRIIRNTTAA